MNNIKMMNSLGCRISNRGLIAQTFVTRLQSSASNATNSVSSEIKIPIKIERGPTDILRAIERTIKRDPTAPRYMYHDDPYLIPLPKVEKRTFALAQESGRKAAMWIREKHADLFQHRVADPIIQSFLPKAIYTKKEDVNENLLKDAIINGHVTDALTIYKLLDEQTTIETKQELFELLCYYNNATPTSDELLADKWHIRTDQKLTWKNCSDTEKLFTFLKEQDVKVATDPYNAMICGTAKYSNASTSWRLFKEAQTKNIPLYLTTYNYLISTIPVIHNNTKERKELLIELLEIMKNSGIQPNVGTLNSGLHVAASIYEPLEAQNICRSLFTEFKHLGIKPSLTSYYYALLIFYRKGNPNSTLLKEILDEIQGQEFEICNSNDTKFFVLAMDIASNTLQNAVIGDRIHKLLLTGNNYDFLHDGHRENIYYRHFLTLQVKSRTIDEFVESYYDVIVPHIHTPDLTLMEAILDAIVANDAEISMELLPRFWTHIVQFSLLSKSHLIAKTFNLMRTQCKPAADSPINKMFGDAVWTFWEYVMEDRNNQRPRSWNGSILGDIAVLLLRADEFEKCSQIISYFYNAQNTILEIPEMSQINELLEACILRGHSEAAVNLVHYCSDVGIEELPAMAYKVWRNLPLSEWQENRLKSLVEPDVLKIEPENTVN